MALRKALWIRQFTKNRLESTKLPSLDPPSNALQKLPNFQREFLSLPPDSSKTGFFRRFLDQKRAINQSVPSKLPEFLNIPVGDKLREKLRSINIAGERPSSIPAAMEIGGGMSVEQARKILRSAQLEKIRLRIKEMPSNSILYHDFVKICGEVCNNIEQGLEFAKILDHSGTVIVLGNVVFLRPDQVTKLTVNGKS